MPTTGVSGVDLYLKKSNSWEWKRGKYALGETITYTFNDINPNNQLEVGTYQLYLPLYNTIEHLKIGVATEEEIIPISNSGEKPIVVYGTSIAQGACASRAGMSWTAILEREIALPVVNLGFSGNALMSKEIIEILAGIDSKLYVLDCLPNMVKLEAKETEKRIRTGIRFLREKRPNTPILLVAHGGYSDGVAGTQRYATYSNINSLMYKVYNELLGEGMKNVFLMTKEEIGLAKDSFVDGTHPTDLGMQLYARAYEQKIKSILGL
jgi:lysophospholipase L1-like esterase